ncbi:MAG: YCF48-related protein [Saprospiraceae bacterium]|nr:YCF48-related protein [Saprospiraceae bacterium]
MARLLPILLFLAACGREEVSLTAFREIKLPVTQDLSAVWFTDSLHGTVTGGTAWASGFLLSTADGGQTWSIDTTLNRKMEHVMFSPNGQGYVCGQDMMLYRPSGDAHWQIMRVDYQWFRCVHFPTNNYGAVVSGGDFSGGQMRVFGPDVFWRLDTIHEAQGELEAVWYPDSTTIIAVGTGWAIRSADGGQSRERLHLTGDFFTSVHFPDPFTGYICGNSGTILKTTDTGKTWITLRCGGPVGKRKKGFRALWFSTPERGWLVGDNGIFWRTTDGGNSWQQATDAPKDADFTDVYVMDGHGWATAKEGRFFVFEE